MYLLPLEGGRDWVGQNLTVYATNGTNPNNAVCVAFVPLADPSSSENVMTYGFSWL